MTEYKVIIANPPYQDSANKSKSHKLWPKFIEKSLELLEDGGYMTFITPDSWVSSTTRIGTSVRKKLTDGFDLQTVNSDADQHFDVGVSICRWSGVKQDYAGTTNFDGESVDLSQPVLRGEAQILESIFSKITDKSITKLPLRNTNTHVVKADIVPDGRYEFLNSGSKVKRTNVENLEGVGVPKFVAPWSCSYKSVFHTTLPTGVFNMWMECEKDDFEAIAAIWRLKVVRVFCERYKKTAGYTPAVASSQIPDFRGLNDAEAYQTLNLTEAEIALIESLCS